MRWRYPKAYIPLAIHPRHSKKVWVTVLLFFLGFLERGRMKEDVQRDGHVQGTSTNQILRPTCLIFFNRVDPVLWRAVSDRASSAAAQPQPTCLRLVPGTVTVILWMSLVACCFERLLSLEGKKRASPFCLIGCDEFSTDVFFLLIKRKGLVRLSNV